MQYLIIFIIDTVKILLNYFILMYLFEKILLNVYIEILKLE